MSNPFNQNETENGFVMNDGFSQSQTDFTDFSAQPNNFSNQPSEVNFSTSTPDEEKKEETKDEKEDKDHPWYHFYRSEFYQKWFDIDTMDLFKRMMWGLLPFFGNFFEQVGENPDMYGPIWIPVSVIFLSFFSGSLASLLVGDYDYMKLTIIAGTILVYIIFVPLIIGLICKIAFKVKEKMSSFYCLFGYAYTIYLIVIPLCAIPYWYVQIPLVAVGCAVMTLALIKNLFQYMKNNSKTGYGVATLIIIVVINLTVAALMIYAVWP